MELSPRTIWPLAAAGLLAVVVIASVAGSVIPGSHPASNVPPDELPAAPALAVSPTPTPRLIDIPGPTTPDTPPPTSLPAPTPTTAALPTAETVESVPDASPSPTPWVMVAEAPTASPASAVQPSPTAPPPTAIATAEPTQASSPTPTPAPTATSIPTPTPTVTPTPQAGQPLRLEFAAEDWTGGYYRGDGQAYGRPWVALYGASSDYPRARLTMTLDAAPNAPATLIVVGLDDEWAELNAIAVEVNGQEIFSGKAPFANWDGLGNGANAAWTPVAFDLPSGVLRAGRNRVTVTSLMPSANFNAPPYLLLSDAVLEIDGQATESDQTATDDAAARGDDREQREQAKPNKNKDKKKDAKPKKDKKEKRKRGKKRKR